MFFSFFRVRSRVFFENLAFLTFCICKLCIIDSFFLCILDFYIMLVFLIFLVNLIYCNFLSFVVRYSLALASLASASFLLVFFCLFL